MLAALLTATLLLFFLCNSAAADPALRPGKWEATVITEMPLSKQPAKQTITQCIEPGNTGPMQKLVQDGNCAIKDKVVEGSSMRWQMECKSRRGATTTGTGRFTSNGDTGAAQIEMTATFQGKPFRTVTSWEGKRIGECDPAPVNARAK